MMQGSAVQIHHHVGNLRFLAHKARPSPLLSPRHCLPQVLAMARQGFEILRPAATTVIADLQAEVQQ